MSSRNGILRDEDNLSECFVASRRINYLDYNSDTLHTIINEHCIVKGQPIVVSNMNKSTNWDSQMFTLNKLKEYRGNLEITIAGRNGKKHNELLGDYIQTLQKVHDLNSLDQFGPELTEKSDHQSSSNIPTQNEKAEMDDQTFIEQPTTDLSSTTNTQYKEIKINPNKVYAKDISCSPEHKQAISKFIPEYLLPHGNNDLFAVLPPRFQAENLMCYLAQDDTGTPMHRDLCGTMGHNIMTMASPGGFAEWIIIVNEDREKLATVMKPTGRAREPETSAMSEKSFAKSSFMESERGWLYRPNLKNSNLVPQVILQKPGDLVIIPSRAYHQVRNVGVSVKIAWNRITSQTLNNAFEDQLKLYQVVCRPEVFKCKAIVYFTLMAWHKQLSKAISSHTKNVDHLPAMEYGRERFINDSNMLLDIYLNKVLYPEALSIEDEQNVVSDPTGEFSTVKCDFCHGDVFYRYYECEECDNYDLCMQCYMLGRSCCHVSDMKMRQSDVSFSSFVDLYKQFISDANNVFKKPIFKDLSERLDSSQLEKSPNLATICRRIERYRYSKGDELNHFRCTHCNNESSVATLAEVDIGLVSIFRRSPCKKLPIDKVDKDIDMFVCKTCTAKCKSCEPLVESENVMKDYDIIYYAQPTADERNIGSFFDVGLERSCDYPILDSTHSTNRPKPKKTKKKNNMKAANKGKGEKKTITKRRNTKKDSDPEFSMDEDMEEDMDEESEGSEGSEETESDGIEVDGYIEFLKDKRPITTRRKRNRSNSILQEEEKPISSNDLSKGNVELNNNSDLLKDSIKPNSDQPKRKPKPIRLSNGRLAKCTQINNNSDQLTRCLKASSMQTKSETPKFIVPKRRRTSPRQNLTLINDNSSIPNAYNIISETTRTCIPVHKGPVEEAMIKSTIGSFSTQPSAATLPCLREIFNQYQQGE